MANYSDLELVDLIRNGDRKGFNILFQRHAPNLIIQLKRNNRISSDVSEDIVLESFLDAYKNIQEGKYDEMGLFPAYINKIAKWRVTKVIRKDEPVSSDEEVKDSEEVEADKNMYQVAAEKALKSLSELCRDLIYYKNYHNFRDDEILENFPELGSVSNVKKRRYKCMSKLREEAELNLKTVTI